MALTFNTLNTLNKSVNISLLKKSTIFRNLPANILEKLIISGELKRFPKKKMIPWYDSPCRSLDLVIEGLVRVSWNSTSGNRLTYLLARPGEPLNIAGLFTDSPRPYITEAVKDTTLLSIKKHDFTQIAFQCPELTTNIIEILGNAVDSSNSRIVDMLEKKVMQRLIRTLQTLHKKFGNTLYFTSMEIAELTGTTVESSLRILSKLRNSGIIKTSRGKISIIDIGSLQETETDAIWL